jgi:hypothetical protein
MVLKADKDHGLIEGKGCGSTVYPASCVDATALYGISKRKYGRIMAEQGGDERD